MSLTIIISLLTIVFSFMIYLLLGRYIQNKYKLLISNTYISYAIGLSVYIAIITLLFMPIIFFAWPTFMLLSVWWIFNGLLIIFLIINLKVINIKNISIKQLVIFIILSVVFLVVTRFLGTIPNSGKNYFFLKWVKSNVDITHLNDGVNIDKYHIGEGWYYFQTVLLRSLGIGQLFMNFWILGMMISFFATSSMLGFIFSIIKKNNILILASSIGVLILITWATYNGETENIGDIPLTWNLILLLTLLINFISRPKINYMYLISIISYAGWSFSYKELILSIIILVSTTFVLLFKKSHLIVEFIIIFSYSIIIMFIILLFNISYIAFSLFLFSSITWLFIGLFTIIHNMEKCREYSLIFVSKKWKLFYIFLFSIILISSIIWFYQGKDSWLHFKYDRDLVSNWSQNKFILGVITYITYWLIAIISLLLLEYQIRKGIGENKVIILLLISVFSIIFFYNPMVATLWNKIFPTNIYFNILVIAIVPFLIIIPLLLRRIKWNFLPQTIIFFGSTISVITLFNFNTAKREHISLYNGADKSIKDVASYINNRQKRKRISGDTDGLFAYINNDLSFPVGSKSFNALRNSELENNWYKNIDITKIDILLKFKDNVSDNFKYNNWFHNGYVSIGNYHIFIK